MVAIVLVNVSQLQAPTPSQLQRTGALISQGGTNTAAGTVSLITQLSDLTTLYQAARAITSITWLSGVATVTTTAPHGFTVADVLPMTIAGVTPAGYNGNVNATITGASTFTYPLASNPGSMTVAGMFTDADVRELCAMATTFFAQGNSQAVYVLELGPGTAAEGVTALSAYITANIAAPQPLPGSGLQPSRFYGFLVPREWAAEPTFLTLLQSYSNPSAMLYFWVTSTLATYVNFTSLNKCVIQLIEAPTVSPTGLEFSLAAAFRAALAYRPGATTRVTPFAFTYLYGVTPYPTFGNSALLQTLKNAAVNIVGTGAEGGISNTIMLWGTTMDGRDFTYWYSADWVQINIKLDVANAIINGSNNPINPLYYNQNGINTLQSVIARTMGRGVTFGLVLGTPTQTALDGPVLDDALNSGTFPNKTVVNAIPFIIYSAENPGDYKIGLYSGFSTIYVPARGFTQIVFQLVLSDFVNG
jgi:hypothetical protein